MSENVKKSTKFTLGCPTWSGTILSIAIIAIRAFQPNATPIETWSVLSWFLMLLPTYAPFVIWMFVMLLLLIWTFFHDFCGFFHNY